MKILGFSGCDRAVPFKRRAFPGLSQREYRIAQGFDSAAALVDDGQVVAAAAEERFSRDKGTGAFPVAALRYCLEAGKLSPNQIDLIAHGFDYSPHAEFFHADDHTSKQYDNVFAPEIQRGLIEEHFPGTGLSDKYLAVDHHLAHACSAFFPSGYSEALVLVSDGMSEVQSATAYVASPDGFQVIREIPALHSLGILYGVMTLYLGFFLGLDEYKVMGLAPYGDAHRYFDDMMGFVSLHDDGSYTIPLLAANKTTLEKATHAGVLDELIGRFGPPRTPESELTQQHMDLAAAMQSVFLTVQLHLLRVLQQETQQNRLCLAGGCALNCSANGAIRRSRLFDKIFVQPASGDDGTALGAALYAAHLHSDSSVRRHPVRMGLPLYGPSFSNRDVERVLDSDSSGRYHVSAFGDNDQLIDEVARRIAGGEVVAWFQGAMEFGPRALGSRSILADPTSAIMRDKINGLVKKREGFRPFAPAVAAGSAGEYFEIEPGDEHTYEHMLFVTRVRQAHREQLPAITHVDGSARVQTVFPEQSPKLSSLLNHLQPLIGYPAVLNTSFNVRGQPIVRTPEEAIETFLLANLDALVLEDYLLVPAAGQK